MHCGDRTNLHSHLPKFQTTAASEEFDFVLNVELYLFLYIKLPALYVLQFHSPSKNENFNLMLTEQGKCSESQGIPHGFRFVCVKYYSNFNDTLFANLSKCIFFGFIFLLLQQYKLQILHLLILYL